MENMEHSEDELLEDTQEAPENRASDHGSDESDETDDEDLRLPQCLPVSGAPLVPDREPEDADEYLRMVQYEAMRCAGTVVSDIDPPPKRRREAPYVRAIFNLDQQTTSELRPTREWIDDSIAYFKQFREMIEQTAEAHHGGSTWDEVQGAIAAGTMPTASEVVGLDCVCASECLGLLIKKLFSTPMPQASTAQWTFAMMTRLDEPLIPDDQCNLQQLRRKIEALWPRLTPQSEELPYINLLWVICTEYFKQR